MLYVGAVIGNVMLVYMNGDVLHRSSVGQPQHARKQLYRNTVMSLCNQAPSSCVPQMPGVHLYHFRPVTEVLGSPK